MSRHFRRTAEILLLLLAALAAPCAAAAPRFDSLALGLKLESSRETGEQGFWWGPTLEAGFVAASTEAATRFKYSAGVGYSDARTKIVTGDQVQQWRVRTTDLRLLKITALRAAGVDLRATPYVSGGVQYVDSRQEADGESISQFYWSPLIGAGVEVPITRKTSLAVDWEQNTEGGQRRVMRLSVELKLALFGATDSE